MSNLQRPTMATEAFKTAVAEVSQDIDGKTARIETGKAGSQALPPAWRPGPSTTFLKLGSKSVMDKIKSSTPVDVCPQQPHGPNKKSRYRFPKAPESYCGALHTMANDAYSSYSKCALQYVFQHHSRLPPLTNRPRRPSNRDPACTDGTQHLQYTIMQPRQFGRCICPMATTRGTKS